MQPHHPGIRRRDARRSTAFARGPADSNGRVTCDARFVAVSGYRKGRKQIDFLQTRSRIAITFAPLGKTGFFTPVDASVGTQIGPVRITAQRIEAR
ncbi:hypothetical protein [Mesorhizobium sediminum]|uniref:hypothetical protein n=1 Tax=Neoaquamicrobium sediminum TaxID=1849104 RepID=UPI001FD3DE73|nr:hypothetical protein [Mesorhizobium sediminum]